MKHALPIRGGNSGGNACEDLQSRRDIHPIESTLAARPLEEVAPFDKDVLEKVRWPVEMRTQIGDNVMPFEVMNPLQELPLVASGKVARAQLRELATGLDEVEQGK